MMGVRIFNHVRSFDGPAPSPSDAGRRILVVAGLISRGSTVLIQQRRAWGPCANLWELPGGKVEVGETPIAALAREATEELGVALDVREPIFKSVYTEMQPTIELQVYRAHIAADAVPKAHAAQRQMWCPLAELAQWPFCPADAELIATLVSGALPL